VWDEHDISSGQTHEMMPLEEDIAAWLGPPSLFIRVDAGNVLEKVRSACKKVLLNKTVEIHAHAPRVEESSGGASRGSRVVGRPGSNRSKENTDPKEYVASPFVLSFFFSLTKPVSFHFKPPYPSAS
jgi:hypothetical protein